MPDTTVKFTQAEAMKYEAIHAALEESSGNVTKAIASLMNNKDRLIKGLPWSYPYLESLMETDAYKEWRRTMHKILMNHAEHSALVRVSNTSDLNDAAKAAVAVNILKGNTEKAKRAGLRGKNRNAPPGVDPAENPALMSETAALLMENDDEEN